MNARSAIRAATADCHDRVDRLYSQIDLAERQAYGRFLTAQAAAHIAAEAALDRAGAASVLADWPARRRAALLRADLATLKLPVPAAKIPLELPSAAAVLGGVYVLEGSRLGGRVLRRSVPPGFPCRFLDAADPTGWRRLLGIIEDRLIDQAEQQSAIAAAVAVFGLFEDSARRHL